MEGKGIYTFASGVKYDGELKNGMFHGQGTLHFPNGYISFTRTILYCLHRYLVLEVCSYIFENYLLSSKYVAKWENGIAVEGKYQFTDGLDYEEENWYIQVYYRLCSTYYEI